ncbi:hypothetical protein EG68_10128 [Paragonimus skrjabini miyazakii]|uniref:Apple domain-containing protein n=1 Tax=Paragonimus skrjabini miyazakii TaxID=59628 RepID=A0A8S9YPK6_9TREM|nr:hypothetical protein EG68_10128 [Paragonimus skrjabini miyazakii]
MATTFWCTYGWSKVLVPFFYLLLLHCLIRAQHINNQSCPVDFTYFGGGVCGMAFDIMVDYCEAHRLCHEEGVKRGLRMFFIGKLVGSLPNAFYQDEPPQSGIHSLLNALYVTNQDLVKWNETADEWNGEQAPTCTEVVCNNASYTSFVCQMVPSSEQHNSSMQVVQFKQNWPPKLQSLSMEENLSSGCFDAIDDLTILMCAQRCQLREVCRSYYYSQSTRECLLSLYVDSRLPASVESSNKSWLRFAKVDYNVTINRVP